MSFEELPWSKSVPDQSDSLAHAVVTEVVKPAKQVRPAAFAAKTGEKLVVLSAFLI